MLLSIGTSSNIVPVNSPLFLSLSFSFAFSEVSTFSLSSGLSCLFMAFVSSSAASAASSDAAADCFIALVYVFLPVSAAINCPARLTASVSHATSFCIYGTAISAIGRNAAAKAFSRVSTLAFKPSIECLNFSLSLYRFLNPVLIADDAALNAALIWLNMSKDSARPLRRPANPDNELFAFSVSFLKIGRYFDAISLILLPNEST